MSIQILCPECGTITAWHRPPVGECAACHSAYPAPLGPNADAALRRESAPKPALLLIGQIISGFIGALFLVVLAIAPFNAGNFFFNGEPVTGHEFLRQAGLVFGLVGVLHLSIAVGLWREQKWVRPLMVLYWLVPALVFLTDGEWQAGDLGETVMITAVGVGCAVWYLYARPNVRAYFEARASRSVLMPNGHSR